MTTLLLGLLLMISSTTAIFAATTASTLQKSSTKSLIPIKTHQISGSRSPIPPFFILYNKLGAFIQSSKHPREVKCIAEGSCNIKLTRSPETPKATALIFPPPFSVNTSSKMRLIPLSFFTGRPTLKPFQCSMAESPTSTTCNGSIPREAFASSLFFSNASSHLLWSTLTGLVGSRHAQVLLPNCYRWGEKCR